MPDWDRPEDRIADALDDTTREVERLRRAIKKALTSLEESQPQSRAGELDHAKARTILRNALSPARDLSGIATTEERCTKLEHALREWLRWAKTGMIFITYPYEQEKLEKTSEEALKL
jgi:predicted  nucleic acid-binding Zn-ribbon protein